MLGELTELQKPSDESIQRIDMKFDVRTRDDEENELIERVYTFCYDDGCDKWTFQEYVERRSPETDLMTHRDWRRVKQCLWHDVAETPDIDVPPQVATRLAKATGSDSVVIQVPRGPIGETTYEVVTEAGDETPVS